MEEGRPAEDKLDLAWKTYKGDFGNYGLVWPLFMNPVILLLVLVNDTLIPNFLSNLFYSLIWLVPYLLYSIISNRVANVWVKSVYRKKYELGILILNGNAILDVFLFSLLTQMWSFVNLVQGFVLGTKSVVIALICYVISDIGIAIAAVKFPVERKLTAEPRMKLNSRALNLFIPLVWFLSAFILPAFLSNRYYLDEIGLKLFILITPISPLFLYMFVRRITDFIPVVRWRKRDFWDQNPDARRRGRRGEKREFTDS